MKNRSRYRHLLSFTGLNLNFFISIAPATMLYLGLLQLCLPAELPGYILLSLEISHYDYIIFDEDNDIKESSASCREIYRLPCELMTVAEYAELSGVTVITVRQWIRRGKLRTARKNGRDWLIPSLSMPPQRGYESATCFLPLCPLFSPGPPCE